MKYWETQNGDEIAYKELEDKHLFNIIKWIEKRANNGITIRNGGGWDIDDMWYEEYEIDGEEVLEMYDYKGLLKEAKKRGLIKNKKK
jgi:hypothetical protein